MPASTANLTPGLSSYLRTLKTNTVESSIEQFLLLLKQRQIRGSKPCALATTQLLLRVVADFKARDIATLLERVRRVGARLAAAQPREMAVGNIVRRVLGLIREVAEDDENEDDALSTSEFGDSKHAHDHHHHHHQHQPPHSSNTAAASSGRENANQSDTSTMQRPPLLTSHTSYAQSGAPQVHSLFGLFDGRGVSPGTLSPSGTSGTTSPVARPPAAPNLADLRIDDTHAPKAGLATPAGKDVKAEVLEGIREILDELDQCAEQIAGYALDHIHADEIVLVHGSSATVQRFLLAAARKRRFTVVHVESYPNDHVDTYSTVLHGRKNVPTKPTDGDSAIDDDDAAAAMEDPRFKPLTAAGITVILIPDSAVFAIMSRVNKCVLAPLAVLANGGLVAAAGARALARAARAHDVPVVVLSGVYKLSPLYPFDPDALAEFGDAGKAVPYARADLVGRVDVVNPLSEYVPETLVDLYITNLGGHAPSYLYRIVADHYSPEDVDL